MIRITPKTICWANTLIPTKVMPMRTTDTSKAPIRVRQTPPTPPVRAVPPTSTAAMAGNRNSLARVGEPLDKRPAMITPDNAARPADRAKVVTLIRLTFNPDAQAAGSPAPTALPKRPNGVLRCRKMHSSSTAVATSTSLGMPAVCPVTQPNQASR
ncbi:hypothetical protein D3C78_1215130 [compost metagenome]